MTDKELIVQMEYNARWLIDHGFTITADTLHTAAKRLKELTEPRELAEPKVARWVSSDWFEERFKELSGRVETLEAQPAPQTQFDEVRMNLNRRVSALECESIRISPSGSATWYKFDTQQRFANWLKSLLDRN